MADIRRLVRKAIESLDEVEGSSVTAIEAYIREQYTLLHDELLEQVTMALQQGVASGQLRQRAGLYRMGGTPKVKLVSEVLEDGFCSSVVRSIVFLSLSTSLPCPHPLVSFCLHSASSHFVPPFPASSSSSSCATSSLAQGDLHGITVLPRLSKLFWRSCLSTAF